ncbi:hypothetical protein HID58_059980 [Brassica napus]|uniref:Uncharacterized protein n=1 Tax=Brassica napus TaxID=3708 RepID=A0ABQ7ZUE7_BRANA|nr:hypothetical protein HID58_059980 [Brassica napus]
MPRILQVPRSYNYNIKTSRSINSRGASKASRIKHEDPHFRPPGLIKAPHPPNPSPRQDFPSQNSWSSTRIWGMSRSVTLYADVPGFSIKPSANSDQSPPWGQRLILIKEKKKVL